VALTLLGLALVPAGPRAQGLTADDLFDDTKIRTIYLSINSRDLRDLQANWGLDTYYTADMTWTTMKVRNVGVRSRGGGSRNPKKLGLLIDFDHYTTGQTFLGMSQLVLDNVYQDPSLMKEFLAMKFYRLMKQVAPREAFCRLYINNEYQGLYVIVEAITPSFVQLHVENPAGYLFEYHFLFEKDFQDLGLNIVVFSGQYLGENPLSYSTMFEPKNHKLDPPATLWDPISDLWREVNAPDDAVWREHVEARLDLTQFVTHVAMQEYVAENDGFLGNWGINNFYLYRFAGKKQHRLIPWDEDHAFEPGFFDKSIFRVPDSLPTPALFTRAMAYRDLYDTFLKTAEDCAIAADKDNWLTSQINDAVSLIRDSVLEDTNRRTDADFPTFDSAIESLLEFAAKRSSFVLPEVARSRVPGVR
jgi:spore coat protein CotH